jgi:hypothetical protein
MHPLNAAILIAVLTTTQCKTAEGQRQRGSGDDVPGSDILLDVVAAGGWASVSGYAHDAGKFGRLTQFFLSIPLRMADRVRTTE